MVACQGHQGLEGTWDTDGRGIPGRSLYRSASPKPGSHKPLQAGLVRGEGSSCAYTSHKLFRGICFGPCLSPKNGEHKPLAIQENKFVFFHSLA